MRQNQSCSGWRMCPPSCPAEAERGLFGGLVPSLGSIRATLGAAFPIQVTSYTALTEVSCRWVAAKLSRIPAMLEHIPCESRIKQLFEGVDSSFCSGKTFLCLTSWPPQLSVSESAGAWSLTETFSLAHLSRTRTGAGSFGQREPAALQSVW